MIYNMDELEGSEASEGLPVEKVKEMATDNITGNALNGHVDREGLKRTLEKDPKEDEIISTEVNKDENCDTLADKNIKLDNSDNNSKPKVQDDSDCTDDYYASTEDEDYQISSVVLTKKRKTFNEKSSSSHKFEESSDESEMKTDQIDDSEDSDNVNTSGFHSDDETPNRIEGKPKVKQLYKCNVCTGMFIKKKDLRQHMKVHYDKNKSAEKLTHQKDDSLFECEFCSEKLKNHTAFIEHLDKHEKYIEVDDGRDTKNTRSKRKKVSKDMFSCKICGAEFKKKWNLKFHLKTHTGEKPYACDLCDARFTRLGGKMTHMVIHTGTKPYKCKVCHAAFNQKGNLERHATIHTGKKPYKCKYCEASFINSTLMKEHNMLHTGEKMYRCETCNLKFLKESSYRKHLDVHMGEKPFKCVICHATFVLRLSYTQHMKRNIHNGNTEFKCPYCDLELTTEKRYNNHLMKHFDPEKKHKCDMCFAEFGMKAALARHKKIHLGARPHKCEKCDAAFAQRNSLQIHMRLHSGETPFKCDFCDLAFFTKSSYTIHMKSHSNSQDLNSFQVPNFRLSDGIAVDLIDRMKVLQDMGSLTDIENDLNGDENTLKPLDSDAYLVNIDEEIQTKINKSIDNIVNQINQNEKETRNREINNQKVTKQAMNNESAIYDIDMAEYNKKKQLIMRSKINSEEDIANEFEDSTESEDIDGHRNNTRKIESGNQVNQKKSISYPTSQSSHPENRKAMEVSESSTKKGNGFTFKKGQNKNKRDCFSIDSLIMRKTNHLDNHSFYSTEKERLSENP